MVGHRLMGLSLTWTGDIAQGRTSFAMCGTTFTRHWITKSAARNRILLCDGEVRCLDVGWFLPATVAVDDAA
jgi:hypothetical protein